MPGAGGVSVAPHGGHQSRCPPCGGLGPRAAAPASSPRPPLVCPAPRRSHRHMPRLGSVKVPALRPCRSLPAARTLAARPSRRPAPHRRPAASRPSTRASCAAVHEPIPELGKRRSCKKNGCLHTIHTTRHSRHRRAVAVRRAAAGGGGGGQAQGAGWAHGRQRHALRHGAGGGAGGGSARRHALRHGPGGERAAHRRRRAMRHCARARHGGQRTAAPWQRRPLRPAPAALGAYGGAMGWVYR